MNKPTIPTSPLDAQLEHEGQFEPLYPLSQVIKHANDMVNFERGRILALLDTFGNQCQAQGQAMSETGHANSTVVNAQLDAVRLLQEAINRG
jgi:hypothetical protein